MVYSIPEGGRVFGSMTGDGDLDSLGSDNTDLNLGDGEGGIDSELDEGGDKRRGSDGGLEGLLGEEGLVGSGGSRGGVGARGRRPAAAVSHLDYEDNDF